MSALERRPRIVKVKDLKPKRIKGYLEYKFSRRSPTLLKLLYFMNSRKRVNTVHVRDQKHELTLPRNRHKPITQQDALPRSDSQPRFSTKVGPVVSVRDIPFVILSKQNIKAHP
ncbi:hypothetical protein GQ457_11G033310 [Hibiscus cannabinus]